MKWFKFYGQDYLTDSKLGALDPFQRLMWVTLLCIASQDDKKTGILKFFDEARLVALSGLDYDDMESMFGLLPNVTIETFCNMGLVTRVDKDTILITNYNKKQTQQSTSTERVSAWRARNRAIKSENVSVTDVTNVTLQSNGRLDKTRLDKNIDHVTDVTSEFSLNDELKKMKDDKRIHIRLLALFIHKKGLNLTSKEELQETIKRHSRSAVSVSKFSQDKVLVVMEECEKMEREKGIKWTLETCVKLLTK